MIDKFLFIGFPYIAIVVFLVGTIYRYRTSPFKVSSLSSQTLETKTLFWGIVPFHFGIIVVFFGHLTAFLFPGTTLMWNSQPIRLIILEVTAFTFGVSILAGLLILFFRRITNPRIQKVTSKMDIVIELILIGQVILGCWIALGYRWGASWFASDLSPYLWSILKGNPDIIVVAAMPTVIKLHILGAFLIVTLFPFTRLIHALVAPLHYISRPWQRVIWKWDRKTIKDPSTVWNQTPPTSTV